MAEGQPESSREQALSPVREGRGLLSGARALIFGVANQRSIAWAIAQAFRREGARIGLVYQGERLKDAVGKLAEEIKAELLLPCDVMVDSEVEQAFREAARRFGNIDCIVHSIAFAPAEELKGRYIDGTREGSRIAHEVSAESLRVLVKHAEPYLSRGSSILTLTYLGSTRAFPHYNVMGPAKASLEASVRYLAHDLGPQGVRVNAVSAPPLRTLAARSIPGFNRMLEEYERKAPLGLLEADAVADVAVFLASDLGRAVTGEVVMADGGFSHAGI